MSPPDSWVNVWFGDGSIGDFAVDEAPRIDAAVTTWLESGGTRDSLIHVTGRWSAECAFLASWVRGWQVNTPESRRRYWEVEKATRDEKAELRNAVGLFGDES